MIFLFTQRSTYNFSYFSITHYLSFLFTGFRFPFPDRRSRNKIRHIKQTETADDPSASVNSLATSESNITRVDLLERTTLLIDDHTTDDMLWISSPECTLINRSIREKEQTEATLAFGIYRLGWMGTWLCTLAVIHNKIWRGRGNTA